MTDYNIIVGAWFLFLLIAGWVLVNAIIDLGAKRVRQWLSNLIDGDSTVTNRITIEHPDVR